MSIRNQAMLVNLTVHGWNPSKEDVSITSETNINHNASSNAGRYIKRIIATQYTNPISAAERRIRVYVQQNTVPWDDFGFRALRSDMFFKFREGFDKAVSEYEATVNTFIKEYERIVNAQKAELGTMFKESDYPDSSTVRGKYGADLTIRPIQESENFIVQATDDDAAYIKEKMEKDVLSSMQNALAEPWDRLYETISDVARRLALSPEVKDGVFTKAVTKKLEKLLDQLPLLNISGDPHLDELNEQARKLLVEPADLRIFPRARAEAKETADDILKKMSGYLGNQVA
jgi:hypothetical protein